MIFIFLLDAIAEIWFSQYPESYMAFIELEEKSLNRFFGRVIRNKNNEEFMSDVLEDCVCIYIGSRGQTFFNLTVSVSG